MKTKLVKSDEQQLMLGDYFTNGTCGDIRQIVRIVDGHSFGALSLESGKVYYASSTIDELLSRYKNVKKVKLSSIKNNELVFTLA